MKVQLSKEFEEKSQHNFAVDFRKLKDEGKEPTERDQIHMISAHLGAFGGYQLLGIQNKIHYFFKGFFENYTYAIVELNQKRAILIIHEGNLDLDEDIFVLRPIPVKVWNQNTLFIFINVKCTLSSKITDVEIVGWLKNDSPKKTFFGKNFMNREEIQQNTDSEVKADVFFRSELLASKDLLRYIRNFHK
jgi:hypothetical protein